MKDKKWKNITPFLLATASSFFLLLSGTTGVPTVLRIGNAVLHYADFRWLYWIFLVLFFVASFGGIAVFFGGVLLLRGRNFLGYVLIALGSGAGLISFTLNLIIAGFSGLGYSFLSYSTLGVFLAFLAEIMAGVGKRFSWLRKRLRKMF